MLSSGQALAALIPLAAAPILGRLYMPRDYGALAAYMALSALFGPISTLQLQHGIIVERSERRSIELVMVSIMCAGATALVAAVVSFVIFFGTAGVAEFADTRAWILLLPASVLSSGTTTAIAFLANRRASYGALARIPILTAATTVVSSIALGLSGAGANGLFISYFLGQAITIAAYLSHFRSLCPQPPQTNPRRLLTLGWRHRDFARYTLPSQFLSVVSLDMPAYVLTAAANASLLGSLQRARSLVAMPLTLIGNSAAQVFRQRASEDYWRTGSCRRLYVRTGLGLFLVGLPPLVILILFGPELFRLVLGPDWVEAGNIARILAPMLLLRLVCSPLSAVFSVVGKQRENLILSVLSLALIIFATWSPIAWGGDQYNIIPCFAAAYSATYLCFLVQGWRYSSI
ncbi:MAG: lipopolysaccharide biosynthesis protein [Hyphomicrobiaceae bacterium]